MRLYRVLVALTALLACVAAAAAVPAAATAPPVSPVQAAVAVAPANPPSLEAFLGSLEDPSTGPAARPASASGCGPDFCTDAQRTACDNFCSSHHHPFFVGLQCCTSNCTTICNCGSVPIGGC